MMGTIRGSAIVLVLVLSARGRAEIQQPVSAEALEGAELNLTCSHPSASRDNIFWYRQFPNRGPEFIVTGFSGTAHSPDPEGTLHISKDKENSTFALRRMRLTDAAVYYCARRRNDKFVFGSGTKLKVVPNLEKSKASIYRVKSQNGIYSACLITDFSPGNIEVGFSEKSLTEVNASVVQVKNPDSGEMEASYGTVLLVNQENISCIAQQELELYNVTESAEEGDTCKIMELDDNFETDNQLNLLSFTLLGLRIVFVKGVALNLLLTFWLWKS